MKLYDLFFNVEKRQLNENSILIITDKSKTTTTLKQKTFFEVA